MFAMDAGIHWSIRTVLPENWQIGNFVDATLFIAFALVYLAILWSFLSIFLPGLIGRRASDGVSEPQRNQKQA